MTAALRCDGPDCGEIVTDPKQAVLWWRVERNGEGIETPRLPMAPLEIPRIIQAGMQMTVNIGEDDADELDPDPEPEDDEPLVVLHFHSARCLAAFAELAAAFEG